MKADQWRNLLHILFVGLFVAWEVNGEIPDDDAPPSAPRTKRAFAQARLEKLLRKRCIAHFLAANTSATEDELADIQGATMDRSYNRHYDTVVQFSAAVRTLTSQSISPNDVKQGCAGLARSCQSWAKMGCHLTSYYHHVSRVACQIQRSSE